MRITTGMNLKEIFRTNANRIADKVGSPGAFGLGLLVVVVWGVTGPLYHYSDTWQLVINTGTSVVTFLMVFLIQNTQNRDAQAMQLKLNELIRAVSTARNSHGGCRELLGRRNQSEISEEFCEYPNETFREEGISQ